MSSSFYQQLTLQKTVDITLVALGVGFTFKGYSQHTPKFLYMYDGLQLYMVFRNSCPYTSSDMYPNIVQLVFHKDPMYLAINES
jgi:hypothetical protein